jgi:hypothetical protein
MEDHSELWARVIPVRLPRCRPQAKGQNESNKTAMKANLPIFELNEAIALSDNL